MKTIDVKSKKKKLEKAYRDKLVFVKQDRKCGMYQSSLVYSAEMNIQTAVTKAYELGSADTLKDTALYLRSVIIKAHEESGALPWPPTDDFLQDCNVLPQDFQIFFNLLLDGQAWNKASKVQRLVNSLGQDIMRAVTKGHWKLPKHILLCMTLRHLFRSKQLVIMMNRFGHCDSYTFSLELETAIATAVNECSSVLISDILRNPAAPSMFHSAFDNFDVFLSTLEGQSSMHSTHGIMMQEVQSGEEKRGTKLQLPAIPRTREHTFQVPQIKLPECYVSNRKSPNYPCTQTTIMGGEEAFKKARKVHLLWFLCRLQSAIRTKQEVPAWSGFMSLLGNKPDQKTTIGYYPVIDKPITEYSTMQECLRQAEEASSEVGQDYVITTFDLGACMKAFPLIWNQPERYRKHIILIGTFHTVCAYLKVIGKKMNGTGLSDIIQEAGLITSGSVQAVMSGKNYDRAMLCHKVMLESLERLLLQTFLDQTGTNDFPSLPEETNDLLASARGPFTQSSVQKLIEDPSITAFLSEYACFREKMRLGQHGKTAQLWISYMEHVWLVLSLLHAVKINDYELYAHSLLSMPDLFFSFRGLHYARYLTFFAIFLANIETTHPGATDLLRCGAFSVARSLIPGNRCAVDKTMEETFQKHAKSRGAGMAVGAIGLTTNYQAYQRWVRTTHERIKYVQATLDLADMSEVTEINDHHRDLRVSSIIKSEDNVQRVLKAIEGFTNPFVVDPTKLVMLASGAAVPPDVEEDVLNAEQLGNDLKQAFIKERLRHKEKSFFDTIKQVNLKTMSNTAKPVKLRSTNNKVTELRQQGNIAFQLLVKSDTGKLDIGLKEIMSYQLTPVPYSLATADNFLTKTDKSSVLHYLTKSVEDTTCPPEAETMIIIDGNAIFHSMTQIPTAFKDICNKVFDMMPTSADFVFSTDMYKEGSIKTMERQRWGTAGKIILAGESTKRPGDWPAFLSNGENKTQFAKLILRMWSKDSNAARLKDRHIIFVSEGKAYKLSSVDGLQSQTILIDTLTSTQEETDTRVILYCYYAIQNGYRFIRVKSPDTDIFFILLHYALQMKQATILLDTGRGNKKRLIDITELAEQMTQLYCSALLGLHAFTGCDSTSAFKGKGKVKPLKVMQQKPKFVTTFAKLGENWNITDELLNELEMFTCFMYGRQRFKHVNNLRYHMLKEKCGEDGITASINIDLSTLPPCRNTLKQHCLRANFQAGIWKRSHEATPDVPLPQHGHGWHVQDGVLQPIWIHEEEEIVLPQDVIDECFNEDSAHNEDQKEILDEEIFFQDWLDDFIDSSESEDGD